MEYIYIYHNREPLLIAKDFADLVGLKNGETVNDLAKFSAIMIAHCKHQIRKCNFLIAAEKNLN